MASTNGPAGRKQVGVDDVDLRILSALSQDGRVSIASLAEGVGVSRANAYARLERLREAGIVEGFSARVNSQKLGLGLTALIFLEVRSPAREQLAEPLRSLPGVEYAAFVTGEHDVVLLARAADVESLREQIMVPLYQQPAVRKTHTVIVLDEVVRRPYVLP